MSWPRARSKTRCAGRGSLSWSRSTPLVAVRVPLDAGLSLRDAVLAWLAMLWVFPMDGAATRNRSARHVHLEPDAGAFLLFHAPPVGDLLDEIQPPPRILVQRRERLAGPQPPAAIGGLHPRRPLPAAA